LRADDGRAAVQQINVETFDDRARQPVSRVIALKNFARGLFAVVLTAAVVLSAYAVIKWLMIG
jgi:hypothetical protein